MGKDIRRDYQPGQGPMRGIAVAFGLTAFGLLAGAALVAVLRAVW